MSKPDKYYRAHAYRVARPQAERTFTRQKRSDMTYTKEEKAAYNKKYKADNRERIAVQSKKYYADNRERIAVQKAAYGKKYRADNRERLAVQNAAYGKKYYADNRERITISSKKYKDAHREDIRARTNAGSHAYKIWCILELGGKCGMCGITYNETNGAIFSAHHRDPTLKDFSIGLSRHKDSELVESELKKCDLLCFNCHRLVHSEEF